MKSNFNIARYLASLTLLSGLMATSAIAGQDRAGGDGLRLGGKLYMLDLVETGVETNPIFNANIEVKKDTLDRVQAIFGDSPAVSKLVATKLAEIQQSDQVYAESLLQVMEMYSWRWVNATLVNVPDEDSSIEYPAENLVQVAIRRDRNIKISQSAWAELDDANRAALIFHEVNYALIHPGTDGKQSSPRAREVTGYLFTSDLSKKGQRGLSQVLGDEYPSLQPVANFIMVDASQINGIMKDPSGIWFGPWLNPNVDGAYSYLAAPTVGKDASYYARFAKTYCDDLHPSSDSGLYTRGPLNLQVRAGLLKLEFNQPSYTGNSYSYVYWGITETRGVVESISLGKVSYAECDGILASKMLEAKERANAHFGLR